MQSSSYKKVKKQLKSHDVHTYAYMHTHSNKTFKLKSQGHNSD